MTRRFAIVWAVLAGCLLAGDAGRGADATVVSGTAVIATRVADLKDQLESGLRVSLPHQRAFIGRVVAMVEAGRLPLALVMSTFKWARPKKPHPFPYFERGLRTRAARLGITI